MAYLYAKFHINCSNGSLVIAIKLDHKNIDFGRAVLLCSSKTILKIYTLFEYYIT
jgi:hypothetical protein